MKIEDFNSLGNYIVTFLNLDLDPITLLSHTSYLNIDPKINTLSTCDLGCSGSFLANLMTDETCDVSLALMT